MAAVAVAGGTATGYDLYTLALSPSCHGPCHVAHQSPFVSSVAGPPAIHPCRPAMRDNIVRAFFDATTVVISMWLLVCTAAVKAAAADATAVPCATASQLMQAALRLIQAATAALHELSSMGHAAAVLVRTWRAWK